MDGLYFQVIILAIESITTVRDTPIGSILVKIPSQPRPRYSIAQDRSLPCFYLFIYYDYYFLCTKLLSILNLPTHLLLITSILILFSYEMERK